MPCNIKAGIAATSSIVGTAMAYSKSGSNKVGKNLQNRNTGGNFVWSDQSKTNKKLHEDAANQMQFHWWLWSESYFEQGNARIFLIIPKVASELLIVSAALRLKNHNKVYIVNFCFEKSHLITFNQFEILIIPVAPCFQKNSGI